MINKINKAVTKLMKKKRERAQINKIRKVRGETITDTIEIQRIVRYYYEELCIKKFENLGEMGKFLETYNFPKLNQGETESLNRLITASDTEAVVKKLPAHKSPALDGFTGDFTKHLRKT